MKDRRKSQRIPFINKIKYGISYTKYSGSSINLSLDGIGIKCRQPFPPGTQIIIEIYLDQETIEVKGIVIWTDVFASVPTMGVRFANRYEKLVKIFYDILNQDILNQSKKNEIPI